MSGLIYKKMSEVMREIGFVGKNQKNTAQGFKFRGIDDMINALYPALTKSGVFMAPRVTSYTTELKEVVRSSGKTGFDKHVSMLVEYDFFAEDGSKVTVGPIAAEGLDSGDKATNKALSAGLKYALIQTFSVPTEDMVDSDSETPTIEPKASSVKVAAVETKKAEPAKPSVTKEEVKAVEQTPAPTKPKGFVRSKPAAKPAQTVEDDI